MRQTQSLVDGTLEDAVEALAARRAAVGTAPKTAAEKRALAARDVLSAIGNNPALGHALVGAGIGAGAGGVGAALGNRGKRPVERSGILSSMLTGGLAGAGLGAGLGAVRAGLSDLGKSRGDAMGPGVFQMGGRQMRVEPGAIRGDPDLVSKVRELTEPSAAEDALGTIGGAIGAVRRAAPITTTLGAIAAPIDYALHSRRLGLGDRIGVGMIDPRNSRQVHHMDRGIDQVLANEKSFPQFGAAERDVLSQLKRDRAGRADVESMARDRSPITRDVTTTAEAQRPPRRETVNTTDANGRVTESREQFVQRPPRKRVTVTPTTIGEEMQNNLAQEGARANFEGYAKDKNWFNSAPSNPAIFRNDLPRRLGAWIGGGRGGARGWLGAAVGRLGGERDLTNKAFTGTRGLKRVGFYAGLPVAEAVGRTWLESHGRRRDLSQIVQDLRDKGLIKEVE